MAVTVRVGDQLVCVTLEGRVPLPTSYAPSSEDILGIKGWDTILLTLGIYEGETPHGLRSGLAIIMTLSGIVCMLNDQQ